MWCIMTDHGWSRIHIPLPPAIVYVLTSTRLYFMACSFSFRLISYIVIFTISAIFRAFNVKMLVYNNAQKKFRLRMSLDFFFFLTSTKDVHDTAGPRGILPSNTTNHVGLSRCIINWTCPDSPPWNRRRCTSSSAFSNSLITGAVSQLEIQIGIWWPALVSSSCGCNCTCLPITVGFGNTVKCETMTWTLGSCPYTATREKVVEKRERWSASGGAGEHSAD